MVSCGTACRRQRLDDEEQRREHDEHPVGDEEDEDPPPVDDAEKLGSDHRREDRGEPAHQRQSRQHSDERYPSEEVAHECHRDDPSGRGAHSLQHAEHAEQFEVRRDGSAEACDDMHEARDDERHPSSDPIAEWTHEQLADTESDRRRREGQLDRRRPDPEVVLQRRKRREVEVDREWAESGQGTEHDHVDDPLPPGQRVSGVHDDTHSIGFLARGERVNAIRPRWQWMPAPRGTARSAPAGRRPAHRAPRAAFS